MTHSTCLTIRTMCDPEIAGAWFIDDVGELIAPPIREARQWYQLCCLNDDWMDIEAGRPVTRVRDEDHQQAIEAMQAAARWTGQFPHHPVLAAMAAMLGTWPLFLLLGHRVIRPYSYQSDLALPGVSGGLDIESQTELVPKYAEDDDLNVSGLLAVGYEPTDPLRDGVRLVLWPLPPAMVDQMIAESRGQG